MTILDGAERIHILPYDRAIAGDFQNASRRGLADQGIAVGQPLCAAPILAAIERLDALMGFP